MQAKPIADMFPHASEDALDLLMKLLQVRHIAAQRSAVNNLSAQCAALLACIAAFLQRRFDAGYAVSVPSLLEPSLTWCNSCGLVCVAVQP